MDIIIDNEVKAQLKEAYDYIRQDSPQNARKIISKITSSISELPKNPKNIPQINIVWIEIFLIGLLK